MEVQSVFYTWLCDQVTRQDSVGELATHAILDESWPKAATDKETLRAYLRSKNLKKLVVSLAVSLREFDEAMKEHFAFSEDTALEALKLQRSRLAVPAFQAWCEMGFPSRDRIASLANSGNAEACAVFALRQLFGINSPENPLLATRLLASSFESGFLPAATILERYYNLVFNIEDANEWLVRGAKSGDRSCVCALHARVASAKTMRLSIPPPPIDEAELQSLVANHVGDTGEVEWTLATSLDALGITDGASALYEAAALKGWPAAYGDFASLLKRKGRLKESQNWLRKGADAGDYYCRGEIAEEFLRKTMDGTIPYTLHERTMQIQNLELAAEHGVRSALLPMATLYERGDAIPKNTDKAMALLSVSYLTAQDDSEREAAAYFIETIFPEHDGKLPLRPAIDWLINSAQKTKAQGISAIAAEAWLKLGMERIKD